MGYKLSGIVFEILKDPKKQPKIPISQQKAPLAESYPIDSINSVGVWIGKEIFNSGASQNDNFEDILERFRNMKRPSPMTLSWKPPEGQIMLFQTLKRKKRKLTMTIFIEQLGGTALWRWVFTEAEVVQPRKETQFERVDFTFGNFYPSP